MKRLFLLLLITNVILAQRGDTDPPDDDNAGQVDDGGAGGGGFFQDLLGQLQDGAVDEDGDGVPDVIEGLDLDGLPTNLTGDALDNSPGDVVNDALGGIGGPAQPPPDLVNQLLNAAANNDDVPPELMLLAAQLGVVDGANSGQLLQYFLLQEMERIISDLENFQTIPLGESGYAVTPFGIIQEQCYKDMVTYIGDLQDLKHYAWKMASSSGNPSVIISGLFSGNFKSYGIMEQCRDVHKGADIPLTGQYCLLDLRIPQLTSPILGSIPMQLGTCWPQSCSAPDLRTTLFNVLPTGVTNATHIDFYCVQDLPWSSGAKVTLCILSFFGALVVIGTLYHLIIHNQLAKAAKSDTPRKIKQNGHVATENTYVEKVHITIDDKKEETIYANDDVKYGKEAEECKKGEAYKISDVDEGMRHSKKTRLGDTTDRLLMSFSAVRNSAKLFDCSQSSTILGALNGIRVLSMFWIILGHSIQFIGSMKVDNPLYFFENTFQHYTFWAILNGVYAVDTFFFLSGLLLTFLTLKQMEKTKGKMNWALFYFHRWWRITPLYMIVLAIWTTLGVYMGKGPGMVQVWEFVSDICKDNWWTNFLYINNLYPFPGDLMNEHCMGWSWYLANDMQFFVISPVILLLLYRYWKAGIASIVSLLLVSFASSIYLTLYWGLGFGFSGTYNDRMREMPSADIAYGKPYTRIPPYLVGMLLGFSVYKLKDRQIKLNKIVNVSMWCFTTAISLALVYGPEGTNVAPIYTYLPPQWLSVAYNTFSRFAFSLTLAWIVFACATGHGGLINSFLSQPFWVPLARLSFGAYLIHPVVMFVALTTKPVLVHATYIEISYFSIASVVLSYSVSYILALLIESPTLGMEKAMIAGRNNKK